VGKGAAAVADLYETEDGVAAVTSDVQRLILRALGEGTKELPELVHITGRSKPTLSSLHMKALVDRGLVEASAHPTDLRRKVFRLAARPFSSADAPAAPSPSVGPALELAAALEAIVAAPRGTPPSTLAAQARRLGALAAPRLVPWPAARSPRRPWMALATLYEDAGLASPVRVNLEEGAAEFRPAPALAGDLAAAAAVLAGFAEGLLWAAWNAAGGQGAAPRVVGEAAPDGGVVLRAPSSQA
jgi:hypothetical protein